MRFYKIRIRNVEAAILTERRTERGYKSLVGSIQSSTLRGALTSSLYLNGHIKKDDLKEFANKPNIVTSNAYPVKDGLESYPAHPFMYECKVERERVNYIGDVIKQLKEGREIQFRIECSNNHIALNYVHPRPVLPKANPNAMFETISLDTELKVSIGVSKHRATTQEGMLYEYEVLIENQEFWTFLGISDELSEYIDKGLEIRIGRGVTRGYGLSKLTDVREINIDEISDKISNQIEEHALFYALTPLLDSKSITQYFPYPKSIDLNEMMAIYGFKFGDYGTILVEKVYGKTRNFSCGWDMLRNIRKPSFGSTASEGSIIVAKLSAKENTEDALAVLSLIGTPVKVEDTIIFGTNAIMPIGICPIGGD